MNFVKAKLEIFEIEVNDIIVTSLTNGGEYGEDGDLGVGETTPTIPGGFTPRN